MTLVKEPQQETQAKEGMLENVMKQFDTAADLIDLNPNIRKIFVRK